MKEPFLAVLSALLISQFLIMHTRIPSGSMIPTIEPGDHLIVNLIPSYYREPKKGEIVVFEYGGEHLIKRVIGEPGDIIDLSEGKIYINHEEVDETRTALVILDEYRSGKLGKITLETPSDLKGED